MPGSRPWRETADRGRELDACGSLWTRIFQVWMRSPRRPIGGPAASHEVVEGRVRAAHFVGSRRECQKNPMMAPLSDDRSASSLLYPMHEGPFDSATATFLPRRGHDRRRTTPTQRRRRGRVLRRWRSVRRDGRSTSTDRQSDADPLRAVAVALRRRRLARRAAMAWPRPLQRALGPVAIAKSLPRRLSDSHSLHAVAAVLRPEPKLAALRRGAS